MKRIAMVAATLAMMASCDDKKDCQITIDTVGDVMPNKHVTITGDFSTGQPLIDISRPDGSMFTQIPCSAAADNKSADCDLSLFPAGDYELGFGVSCFDPGDQGGEAMYAGAKTITIP